MNVIALSDGCLRRHAKQQPCECNTTNAGQAAVAVERMCHVLLACDKGRAIDAFSGVRASLDRGHHATNQYVRSPRADRRVAVSVITSRPHMLRTQRLD